MTDPRETLATEHSGPRPARERRRYLAVFEESSSRVVPLPESGEVFVGRGDEVGVRVRDAKVSRKHVSLELSPERVQLVDLGSQNGSYVNGERVSGSRTLLSGDSIELGHTAIVFHADGAEVGDHQCRGKRKRPPDRSDLVRLPALGCQVAEQHPSS